MNVALIGHPLTGKSTLFSALTHSADSGGYTDKARLGTVKVPDSRVEWLAELYKPRKITHAGLEFTDLPGLSFASSSEQAQSLKLISDIRQTDMIVLVLRAFENPAVPAYRDRIDPAAGFTELRSEFILCDMEQVSNRIEKLKVQITKPTPDRERQKRELDLMEQALQTLETEQPISSIIHSPEDAKIIRSFGFLTRKPLAVLLNVSESQLQNPPAIQTPPEIPQLTLCASLEYELAQLGDDERSEFMAEMAVKALAAPRLIACCYQTLGLVSFLTYGSDECRAWTVPADTPALEAAGKIHSDIQRGFIRAEVITFEELKAAGDFKQAKVANKLRLEPKTYSVQDGDVITFRFNV